MTLKTFTMDSNKNKCPLMETPAQEVADSIVATNISAAPLQSKEEVIARLEEINQQETTGDKSELDLIKQTFYRLRNAEVELAKKEFESNGGNPENFVAPKDDFEIKFKELMSTIKERRNAQKNEEEQERQNNLAKKLAIIDRMKELADSQDDTNHAYNEFKSLLAGENEEIVASGAEAGSSTIEAFISLMETVK